MNINNLPITIENGAGEKLTFLRVYLKDGQEYVEVENEVQPGAGPPMHVHYEQDECMTVVKGKIGYQELGNEKKYAEAGATILFKAGIPHKFWNAGDSVLLCKGYATPVYNLVYFLSELFKSTQANGKRPGIFDAAFLLNRYKSEFGMLEIPPFVQKRIFPIILLIGKIKGRYKKFKDAPFPLQLQKQ